MATGSVLASTAGYAYADAGAVGAAGDSPGVGSDNTVQAPIDIPVNVCGDTINVVGALNPAMGNNCQNSSRRSGSGGGASAHGSARHSPGVGSGNTVQAPIDVPVNACGDTVNVVGLGNGAFGNQCENHSHGHTPPPPPKDVCPPPQDNHPQPPPPEQGKPPVTVPGGQHHSPPPPEITPPVQVKQTHHITQSPPQAVLASTGAGDTMMLLPAGAAMALGGLLLYRRSSAGQG
jgi:hypothetical protein